MTERRPCCGTTSGRPSSPPATRWATFKSCSRKGGTTAPYLTLEFLTQGRYDAAAGQFLAKDGRPKFYVASDHAEQPAHRRLQPLDLFDVAVREELHWNAATQTGVVFHMLAAVSEQGFFGLTAVGDSREQARDLYDRTLAAVAAEAEQGQPAT